MQTQHASSRNQLNRTQSRPQQTRNRRRDHTPRIYEVIIILVFLFLTCVLSYILIAGLGADQGSNPALTYARQTQRAMTAAVTTTPFQPLANAESTPTASEPEDKPEITTTPTRKTYVKPEGQVNILLLGSDVRPDDGGFRTDSIIWLSLNPKDGFVSAISFPRDLYVYIPGYGENRINTAFPRGGFELLADTFENIYGIRPDHYALIDFNGFKAVINNLGGITVQTEQNLSDTCATWINPNGYCSVGPGSVHMNGEVALWYARSRYSSNDIDRARRAQEVIKAIFNRLMSLDAILRAPDLYNAYTNYVETDLTLSDILPLLPLATQINENGDFRNYVVGYDQVYDWITFQGAQVLIPDYDLLQAMMIEALNLE